MQASREKRILLIAEQEKRNRYQFILEPLKYLDEANEVNLYLIEQLDIRTILNLSKVLYKNQYQKIILATPGFFMVWVVLLKFITRSKSWIVVRSGGDLYRNSKSLILTSLNNKQFFKAFYHFLTRGLQVVAFRYCDAYILVSGYLLKEKHYGFLKNSPVYIIPQAKEVKTDRARVYRYKKYNFNMLTVTNLAYKEKYDGIVFLLDIMSMCAEELLKEGVSVSLHILGGGKYKMMLDETIQSLPPQSNLSVFFHGFKENVDAYYAEADVFVYCSFMDLVPNVVLEAQSHGLPVLFYATPELINIFGDSALPFCNQIEFLSNFKKMLSNNTIYEQYALKGISNIRINYSLPVLSNKYKAVIND